MMLMRMLSNVLSLCRSHASLKLTFEDSGRGGGFISSEVVGAMRVLRLLSLMSVGMPRLAAMPTHAAVRAGYSLPRAVRPRAALRMALSPDFLTLHTTFTLVDPAAAPSFVDECAADPPTVPRPPRRLISVHCGLCAPACVAQVRGALQGGVGPHVY